MTVGLGCGKTRYPNLDAAETALLKCRIRRELRNSSRRRETRAYPCKQCAGWHLTSKPGKARP